ncbi:PAS domain S-box protein [Candidatus Sulfurimonas marisnigri]|uniref:histidine kinase n=1 Tax=Candidatus Sulfurimonas marisnigri TaxID=2740405 RepID=A0A7S7M244_9BACT|nr:ATP-binding protein [Candidatus Sulfurimonas marisnigri]QOY55659.1 PAS domain S-box protein [Candidatus Sulfurimonas marisnigri]
MGKYLQFVKRSVFLWSFLLFIIIFISLKQLGSWYVSNIIEHHNKNILTELTAHGNTLDEALDKRFALLYGLKTYIEVQLNATQGNLDLNNSEIFNFAKSMHEYSSAIRNITIAPNAIQSFVYPAEDNKEVLGHNLLSDTRISVVENIKKAIETKEPILDGPYELRQGGLGVVLRLALFKDENFWGIIAIAIDLPNIFLETGMLSSKSGFDIAVRSMDNKIIAGSIKEKPAVQVKHRVIIFDKYVDLIAYPAKNFYYDYFPWIINSIVLIIAIMLSSIVYIVANRQVYLKSAIEKASFELQKESQDLKTIIQEAPNPIMIHNEDGEVMMINKVWERLTGYNYEEINTIEKWVEKAYGKKSLVAKKYIDKLYTMDEPSDHGEYNLRTSNGNIITWQFSSAPLNIIGGKRTVISSAMDITELKRKDELMIVQSRHAAMGEMIGMIAHQWRQPLSVIAMNANNMLIDIALDDFNESKAEEYSKNVIKHTKYLSDTIDDFRNFFKPDKSISKVKVKNILEKTYVIIKDSLANNNIELITSYNSDSEVEVYQRELMQVFVNILNNAKDALEVKHIRSPIIEVKIYEDKEYVNTEICDNGIGIDKAILSKIFNPYFSTKDEKNGTGLGLYMSKMIIENHLHGTIEVINKDIGTCFRIRLKKSKS